MSRETTTQRRERLFQLVESLIENLNKDHNLSEMLKTECIRIDGELHVKGWFWRDAIILGRIVDLGSSIKERDHAYFY